MDSFLGDEMAARAVEIVCYSFSILAALLTWLLGSRC
jgi:hypothetical protein